MPRNHLLGSPNSLLEGSWYMRTQPQVNLGTEWSPGNTSRDLPANTSSMVLAGIYIYSYIVSFVTLGNAVTTDSVGIGPHAPRWTEGPRVCG